MVAMSLCGGPYDGNGSSMKYSSWHTSRLRSFKDFESSMKCSSWYVSKAYPHIDVVLNMTPVVGMCFG